MSWIRFFKRRRWDEERAQELEAHLQHEVDDNVARGMTAEEARRQAHVRLGSTTRIREEIWTMNSFAGLENLGRDVRFALRQMGRAPGFAVVAISTLALGIGAAAAMFSVIDAVVLKPLPYPNAARIMRINTTAAAHYSQPESWPEMLDLQRLNRSFSQVAGVANGGGVTLKTADRAVYLHAVQSTSNFFDLFGVAPVLGRTYLPGEDQPGKSHVVVLSYSVWQQFFDSDKGVVGRTVDLDGSPYTVIGVMPAGFRVQFDASNVVYTPLQLTAELMKNRGSHWLPAWGLLKPGVTAAQATADIDHVFAVLGKQFPEQEKGKTAHVISLQESMHLNEHGKDDHNELWLLLAAVGAVLLIACTNVAGLLLARGLRREREMAVRAALGAGRGRLAAQTLTESVVLGLAGGVCGIGLGELLLAAMKQFLEKSFARGGDVKLNMMVTAATFVVALLAAVGAGLIPAWRSARPKASQALKSGLGAGTSRGQHRLRATFVVVQVALSLVLLVCSGLLLQGLRAKLLTNLGFNAKNLLTLEVDIPTGDYKTRDFVTALIDPLEQRVAAIPGVTAVGSNDLMPILQWGSNSTLTLVGHAPDPSSDERLTEVRFVTPGYLAAMQLPLVKGRDISTADTKDSQPVAVVNEAWAKEFLKPGEDPLSQAFNDKPPTRIVGVAASGRQDITEQPMAEADFPFSQMPDMWKAFIPQFYLFVRTDVAPTSIVPALRRALQEVAPNVAFRTPETMESVLDDALVTDRMLSWLFGLFAAIAVLLTAVGIYGLLSQEVASRTRDIGLRMALGATRSEVARLMLVRTGLLLSVGVGVGLAGVFASQSVLKAIVPIHAAQSAGPIAAVVMVLALVGLGAAAVPVRRAAHVEPMEALRTE